MKKTALMLMACVLFISHSIGQVASSKQDRMAWWKEAKLGMFIHWGLYSVPAGVWNGKETKNIGEWILNDLKIPVAEYKKYAEQFNPTKFNADFVVKMAKEAGMKYIVITAKHHEGFAMFQSVDKFNIIDATPFKRDVIKEMAQACKKYKIPFGIYYSQAQDWTHPGGASYGKKWDSAQIGSMDKYIDEVAVPQVKELLTKYGPISVFWWDTPADMNKERATKILEVMKLQPNIIQNDRLGGGFDGDLKTPEQYIPETGLPGVNWESCMTMNDTWGFKKNDHNWKSTEMLVRNLIDIASKGGNYLLNIGPTSEGEVPKESIDRLQQMGKWLAVNGKAIYGTSASPFKKFSLGRCTQKTINGKHYLYFHIFNMPTDGKIQIQGLGSTVANIAAVADAKKTPIPFTQNGAALSIDVSKVTTTAYATVLEVALKNEVLVYNEPEITTENNLFVKQLEAKVSNSIKDGIVRYTTDGTEPTATSTMAGEVIKMTANKDVIIKAKTFVNNQPVTETVIVPFTYAIEKKAINVGNPQLGIAYRYFHGTWGKLPNFNTEKVIANGVTNAISLAKKQRNDNYGLEFSGLVKVPQSGIYTFFIASDDGSKLRIDDEEVDNDGTHDVKEKKLQVALQAGYHSIRVQYFQQSGGASLEVKWKSDKIAKAVLPANVLYNY